MSEPAGWYPDPGSQYRLRYWDGDAWSTFVAVGDDSVEVPLPGVARDETTDLPARSAWWALGGYVVSAGVAIAISIPIDSLTVAVVVPTLVFWIGLLATMAVVSRRYGDGSVRRDFGFSVRVVDLAGGLASGIAARAVSLAAVVIVFVVIDGTPDAQGQFDVVEQNDAALYAALALAAIGAPVVEELFFRGFLQRALEPLMGLAGAIVLQAVLFGAAHMTLDGTFEENVVLAFATGTAGLVLGLTYKLAGRLGPAIVGHAVFNLVAVIVVLATR